MVYEMKVNGETFRSGRFPLIFTGSRCQMADVYLLLPPKDSKKPSTMRQIMPFFSLVLFLLPASTFAQTEEKPLVLLTPRDSLILTVKDGKKFIGHPVKPKQTLYALTKYYGLSLGE